MSLLVLLAGCGEGATATLEPLPPKPRASTGTVLVANSASGDALDEDGFEVALQAGGQLWTARLPLNDSVRFAAVDTGVASVVLLGVEAHCQVQGGLSQFVTVGRGTQRVTFSVDCRTPLQPPAISLLFVRGSEGIHRLDPPWISATPLHPGDFPAGSPDGTRIAFRSGTGIAVMNRDGTDLRQLTPVTTDPPLPWWQVFALSAPAWSPDGTRLVYADRETGGLSTIDSDGTGRAVLTMPAPAEWLCPGCPAFVDQQPAWSPDGRQIAFGREEDLEFSTIWIMNADGSNAIRLARRDAQGRTWAAWGPVWAPDGSRIAFAGLSAEGGTSIFVTDRADRVVHLPAHVARVGGWSPDGHWLVFAAVAGWEPDAPGDLFLLHVQSGTTMQLTHDGTSRSPTVLHPRLQATR